MNDLVHQYGASINLITTHPIPAIEGLLVGGEVGERVGGAVGGAVGGVVGWYMKEIRTQGN